MDKQTIVKLKAKAFDKQLAVMHDPSRRIALHIGRRGGKTTTIALLFFMIVAVVKNIRLVYIGLTGEQAKDAFMPNLQPLLDEFNFIEGKDYKFDNSSYKFTWLETKSTISLKGFDTSYKEMNKILGGKCFAVAMDEMQDQTQDAEKAIDSKIGPAVSDYILQGGGKIYLIGTAGDFATKDNFWYKVSTEPDHLGWSYHTWLDKENPYMAAQKEEEDKDYEKRYGPQFRELPFYRQQYLNQWILDEIRKVYYITNDNIIETVPPDFLNGAQYILGMDWGFSPDPMAFTVTAYNLKYSNVFMVLEEFQKTEMFIKDVDAKIRELNNKYHFQYMVADAGAQAKAQVADLNANYGWSIEPADKLGKLAHQNSFNSDLQAKHILIKSTCEELIHEMRSLIWDPVQINKGVRKEKESMPNNLADAMLYAHFYSRHHWYNPPKPKPGPPTMEQQNYDLAKELIQRRNQSQGYVSAFAQHDFTKAGYRAGRR